MRNSIVFNIARAGIALWNLDDMALRIENTTVFGCGVADTGYGCVGFGTGVGIGSIEVRNSIVVS